MHLDLRHLGEKKINAKIPFVRELCLKYQNLDPVKDLIPVRPVVHYMMGGVHTDMNGATPLPGLYAAGEVACVSINGANRLGSNSLPELLVFGARAGLAAAEYASLGHRINPRVIAQKTDEHRRLEQDLLHKKGHERIATLRDEMQKSMERGCGVYRDAAGMQQTVRELAQLKQRAADLEVADASKVFNTELVAALELRNMVEVAEAIAVSAEHRRESRGAHTRRDAPRRDDQNFLYHTLCFRGAAGPRLDKKAVALGRWVPEERKY